MTVITLPYMRGQEEVSMMVMEQEESETSTDSEYPGLMGYFIESGEEEFNNSIYNTFIHFDYYNTQLESEYSQPETPPPNV
jgi:hypothetical protein